MTGKVDFTNLLPEEEKKTVDISEVKDVSDASNQYLSIESEINGLEDQLKRKKAELMQMNDAIVQLMDQRGVKEIKLTNGDAVSYKEFYRGTITKEKESDV